MSALLTLSTAFLCAFFALAVLERLAPHLGLIDHPSGHKSHTAPTPVVGGIGMVLVLFGFAPSLIAEGSSAWAGAASEALDGEKAPWLFGGIAASAVLGLIDDRHPLGAKSKLCAMLVIFAVTLWGSGTVLLSLGELLPGVGIALGQLALPFTLFAAIGVINAFNLIDGMDGLAGSVALCALCGQLLVASLVGAVAWIPFLLVMIAAVGAFLLFNLPLPRRSRARMFMGDAGSLAVGLILLWLAVDLSQAPAGVAPMVMVWLLALPMLDTVATMLLRIREGKSIFEPGHDHFHHLLRAQGMRVGHIVLTATLLSLGSGAAGIGMWLAGVPDWVSLAAFLIVTLAYVRLHLRTWSRLGRGGRNAASVKLRPRHSSGR